MVYGTYNYSIHGAYKSTYNELGHHLVVPYTFLPIMSVAQRGTWQPQILSKSS